MSVISRIQGRFPAIIFTGIVALLFFLVGAVMTFVVAPRQEAEWRRIERMPGLDAGGFAATPRGQEVVITGELQDNRAMTRHELAAYRVDEWIVRRDEDGDYQGRWLTVEVDIPALAVAIDGGIVKTTAFGSPSMRGNLHEYIQPGYSNVQAVYNGHLLPDGTLRTQGVRNRDLVTIVGRKTSTGNLRPDLLYAGDRAQLVNATRRGARALGIIGTVLMIVGPLLFVVSVLFAAFGRRTA